MSPRVSLGEEDEDMLAVVDGGEGERGSAHSWIYHGGTQSPSVLYRANMRPGRLKGGRSEASYTAIAIEPRPDVRAQDILSALDCPKRRHSMLAAVRR